MSSGILFSLKQILGWIYIFIPEQYLDTYKYFQHWKTETQRLSFDFKQCDNLFIDVSPEVCLKRIKRRGRNVELAIYKFILSSKFVL